MYQVLSFSHAPICADRCPYLHGSSKFSGVPSSALRNVKNPVFPWLKSYFCKVRIISLHQVKKNIWKQKLFDGICIWTHWKKYRNNLLANMDTDLEKFFRTLSILFWQVHCTLYSETCETELDYNGYLSQTLKFHCTYKRDTK